MTPARFKEELQRFDKRLDFIFNGRKSRWEIIGEDLKHKKYLIAKFRLGELDKMGPDIIRSIAAASPVKSSAKEVNQRIDNIIDSEEKAEDRHTKDAIHERLSEAWERFQYAEGSRVSFANVGANSKNEKVVITDRRRIISDGKGETNVK